MTVTELTAEFHALNQRYAKALDRGESTDALIDEQARLSMAIIDTRSTTVTELRQKFDLMLYWQEIGSFTSVSVAPPTRMMATPPADAGLASVGTTALFQYWY